MKNFSSKTKKNYLRSSSKHTVRNTVVLTILAVLCAFVLRGLPGNIFSGIASSVLSVRSYWSTSSAALPMYMRERSELFTEIQNLKESIGAESGNAATIERLTHENTEFRTLLGNAPEARIGAGVIARPPYVPYDVLVIDQGSDDGIQEGAFVYHASDFVIGYIEKVFSKSAIVALFSSPHVESTVYVFGPNVYATAYGEGGGVIRISVPQGVSISEGNVVVLPMLETGMLGTIENITSLPTQPEQHAFLSFPVSMQSIRLVSVAQEPIQTVSFDDALENIDAYRKKFILDVPPEFRLTIPTTTATTTETGGATTSTTTQ